MRNFVVSKERITKRDSHSINSYFDELTKIPLLTLEEEEELGNLIKEGDINARNKLVKHNLRFVISVAKQYDGPNVKFEDLVNEGNMGLIKAAENYDISRGFKFISYAVWWIRQRMLEYISQTSKTIRTPNNKNNDFYAISKRIDLLEQSLERKPSYDEIIEEVGGKYNKASIDFYVNKNQSQIKSLTETFSDDNTGSLIDLISDSNSDDPSKVLDSTSSIYNMNALLSGLSKLESLIIQMLFGFNDYEAKTSIEVAKELGISPVYVVQVKRRALKKIKYKLKNQASWMIEN